MDAHRHDSPAPASPRCLGGGRRHSPWTASRQRKKNRQDEHLPVCVSDDDEAEEAATMSKSCEDMIVDLQSMGFGISRPSRPDADPSWTPPEAKDAAPARPSAFLFMPCILGPNQGGHSPGVQQSSASFGNVSSLGAVGGCVRAASANFLPSSRLAAGTSPRRNSTSVISWRDQHNDTSIGSFLACLSPVALSTDVHGLCAAAAAMSSQNSGSDDQDQQRKSMKRRSLERTDGSLTQALRAAGMDTVRGPAKDLLPPSNSPAMRPRRRAAISKNSTSCYGRTGDQATQKDQRLHSQSLPFPLESKFHEAPVTGAHAKGEVLTSSCQYTSNPSLWAFGPPQSFDVSCRPAMLHGSAAEHRALTPLAGERLEEVEGFRILTVLSLTGNDLDLAGSSDRLARRDQHLRAASASAAGLPRPQNLAASAASSPLLQRSSYSASDPDYEYDCEELDETSSSYQGDEEQWELGDEDYSLCSPMEGLAVRLIHTEQDFQTPPTSPQADDQRRASRTGHLFVSSHLASGLASHKGGHRSDGSFADDDSGCSHIPAEQILTLEEFNKHLYKAARLGNRCRADNLWAELCCKGVRPNVQTLNLFLKCLANSFASPDEAESLAREICKTGKLSPNSLTYDLLAQTRIRYEQLGLFC